MVELLTLRVIIKPERKLTLGSNSVLTSRCSCLITLLETVLIANGSHKIIAISLVNREKEKNNSNGTYNIHKIMLTHSLLPCGTGQSLNSVFCFNIHKLPWIYFLTFWNNYSWSLQGRCDEEYRILVTNLVTNYLDWPLVIGIQRQWRLY